MSHLNSPVIGGNAAFDIEMELAKASAYSQKHHAILAAVFQTICVGPQPFDRDIVRLASPVWLTVTSSSLSAYSRPEQAWSGLYREEGTQLGTSTSRSRMEQRQQNRQARWSVVWLPVSATLLFSWMSWIA